MVGCSHELLEWEQKDEQAMHWLGWCCRHCRDVQIGECHHETWCRRDFCGSEPVEAGAAVELQAVH